MLKVKNKKAVKNLSVKSFRASKTRNIIAVIAIALTTILFTSLFTIGIGTMESIQQQTMRQSGGDGHIAFKYLTEEQYKKLSSHKLVKETSYNKLVADSVTSEAFLKRRLEMYYMDEIAMRLGFCTPTTGKPAALANEIAMDTFSLDLLGVPHTLGSKVALSYTIGEKEYTTDFVLSGFWESDTATNVGYGLVSEEFTKVNAEALSYTYDKNHKYSGVINSYVMCGNSRNLKEKMNRIVTESGYTVLDNDSSAPPLATDISCNTNWVYVGSGGVDSAAAVGAAAVLLLIVFTGYLIIFNVFQISVLRDIRFYGLLKTVGATAKQLKRIVLRQALLLSVIGIPIGLAAGFIIGKAAVPLFMSQSSYTGETAVSVNPLIFLGASLFSLFTVFLSTRKPCKIASEVFPVEAVKYSGEAPSLKKRKRTKDGGKIYKMAFSNLSRNKKRTVVTILSLSLSLVLLNTVFTVAHGFDMDKYLARFVDTDFLIGHANYFNMNLFRSEEDAVSEAMIKAVEEQPGFSEGGRLYYNITNRCSIDRAVEDGARTNTAADGKPMLQLYGLEQLPLSRLKLYDGELDFNKLATGKYIIEGMYTDDDGKCILQTSHYNVGDTVTINIDGKPHEFEVLCRVGISTNTASVRYSSSDYAMYLPSETYKSIVENPVVMSYAYNIKDGSLEQMEAFIKNYTDNVEPLMNYESKLTYVKSFEGLQNVTMTVGGILSAVMGLIGLLNFTNSTVTSIVAGKREFAALQSIGMTKKQLIQMLCLEGIYYALITTVVSVIIGALFSVTAVGGIIGTLWMFSYSFTLLPILVLCPILLILGAAVPLVAYHGAGRQSIVERLREAE